MAQRVLIQDSMTVPLSMRIGFCVVWLLTVVVGIAIFLNYENTSGQTGATPEHWPEGTQIALDPKHDTLVMFVHSQCSCTRASMEELNRALAQSDGRISANVLFLKPENASDDWMHTGLWKSAAEIPGVKVFADPNGETARKFGAETSGYVLLYDAKGHLLFKGGVTASRGHAGDNAGEEAIVALSAGQNINKTQTPVYGCSLLDNVCSLNGAVK